MHENTQKAHSEYRIVTIAKSNAILQIAHRDEASLFRSLIFFSLDVFLFLCFYWWNMMFVRCCDARFVLCSVHFSAVFCVCVQWMFGYWNLWRADLGTGTHRRWWENACNKIISMREKNNPVDFDMIDGMLRELLFSVRSLFAVALRIAKAIRAGLRRASAHIKRFKLLAVCVWHDFIETIVAEIQLFECPIGKSDAEINSPKIVCHLGRIIILGTISCHSLP